MKRKLLKTFLLAAGLLVGGNVWGVTYTTAYNKALTADASAGVAAWEATDISATEWIVSDGESNMGTSIEAGAGLVLSIQSNTTGLNSVTKTFSAVPSDGIVMYEVNWYPYRTYDSGNKSYSYIQFGDKFRLTTGYSYYADTPLYVNYDGNSSNKTQLMSKLTTASHSIVVKMNCKNKEILQLTIDGTDYTSHITTTLTGSNFNTLTMGAKKDRANSWNNQQWYSVLSTVKVSYLPNAVNVWNFLDTDVWGKYTSSGASDNYKVSATGSEVWFAPDGSSATSETSNVSFKFATAVGTEKEGARFNYGDTRGLGYGQSYDSTNDINFVKVNIPANFQVIVNYTLGSTGRPLVFNLAGATESKTTSGTYTYTNETGAAVTLKMYETNSKKDHQTTCIKDIKLIDTDNAESYGYTVNAVDGEGNVLKTLTTGSTLPYNNYSVTGIPYVISNGGSYYELSDAAASNLSKTFTMGEKSVVNTISYALKNDIALFQEYESLNANGARINAWGNTNASNGNGAFIGYTSVSPTTTATSNIINDTGVYDIIVRACDRSGKTETKKIYLTDGKTDTEIGTLSSSNSSSSWATTTISNVLITSGQYLKLLTNTASANDTFVGDYILVRKKCDVVDASKIVGAVDHSTNYATVWNSTPVWINAGETGYYKIKNWNNTESANLYENWYIWAANVSSENLVIFGPDHSNTATNGTYTSKPTFTMDDLNGATVELYFKLTDAGDGTYTWTTTAVTTKADGTKLTPNLVYTQTGINVPKLKAYVSVEKNWLEVLEQRENFVVSAPITSTTGYATFSSTYALDFTGISTLTAYKATACDGTKVKLEPITGTVAANTGLVIKGETTNIPVVATGEEATGNLLKPCDGSWTTLSKSDDGTNYVLSEQGNPKVAKFAPIGDASATLRAGVAYLYVPTTDGSRTLNIVFADEATAISAVQNSKEQSNEVYNLAGQRVAQPAKGLYIVNGKKVIMK